MCDGNEFILFKIAMGSFSVNLFLIILSFGFSQGRVLLKDEEAELIFVSVIFRHGARTTDSFYPNDPNSGQDFYPIGLGGLTNEGKLGEYQLGKYLRNMYGHFIGDVYTEDLVYLRSTDLQRTKMSALLVAAGLFPPSDIQKWNPDLLWQPIPVTYHKIENEDLFDPGTGPCPYKAEVMGNLNNIEEVQETYINPYKDTFSYIEGHSGKSMNDPRDIQSFFFIIKTETDMNMTVPKWTEKIYPEPTQSIAAEVYGYYNYNPDVKRINVGYLLKRIIDDSRSKINGNISPSGRKMLLFSGHESTLGYMMNGLNVGEPHVPPYGSALSFEIYKKGDEHFIKLRYRDATDAEEPIDLTLPDCDVMCSFDTFVKLQEEFIPKISLDEACKKTKTNFISENEKLQY